MNMKRNYILVALLVVGLNASAQTLKWPAVTSTTKPWTRWWWEGSAVNEKDLSWNLEAYQKAGLGGVEITPIYGIYGAESQFIPFLSPKWMQMLQHTLNESKRLKLGVDMANATGWPFGGPWVSDADASKTVLFKTYTLKEGEQLTQPVEYLREAMVRTANNKPVSADTLLQPVSANKNLQSLALDQIQYPGKLPLQTLMAYDAAGKSIDLTKKVDATGKLNWTAPAGNWTLYALFTGLHGKMVERGAPGGEGYAIDHFSLKAANNYFKPFDKAFKGYDLSYLRGFFNDSYEVDDARGQSNWTPDFFEQFKKRKGYDLREQLPALFGKSSAELNSRVIYDYRSVIDELILFNFTHVWKNWAAGQKKIVRNQSHGSPANTLDLYSVVDIPETEGTDVLRFKFASSAANVTGKKLVASESATWLNEHFLSSLGDVKKAIDLYFLGGVNHIVYHGTAYSPKEVAWPGWLFYAAVHFQQTNPQWKDFHQLNEYITRVQSFLQQGRPANDVLLYYPITDRYATPGNTLLQHFDGMEKNFEKTDFEEVAKWMVEEGVGFDFFSDRQLQQFTMKGNSILTGGNPYKTILLPANKLIEEKSLAKLVDLAKRGATILVYKEMPAGIPGLASLDKRQGAFQKLMDQLHFIGEGMFREARIGAGLFIMCSDMQALMEAASVHKVLLNEKEISVIKRIVDGKALYFITNRNDKPVSKWITLAEPASAVGLFDPMTGKTGMAEFRENATGQTEVWIQAAPYESYILKALDHRLKEGGFAYAKPAGEPVELSGEWKVKFLEGGPQVPQPVQMNKLQSWTEFNGEVGKSFSGTALYTLVFDKPAGHTGDWLLNLGKVGATAEVKLNGESIGTLIGPVFSIRIPESLVQDKNKLEITVANLMANRIAWMDRNDKPWKIFYNTNMPARKKENVKNGLFYAGDWAPQPSGLLGPVTLTPLKPF
jgi:hypothetical protein